MKDENGQLMGVDTSKLLVANSGNDLAVRHYKLPEREIGLSKFLVFFLPLENCFQVIDLSRVSQELADLSSDADLVIIEGMVMPIYSVKVKRNLTNLGFVN